MTTRSNGGCSQGLIKKMTATMMTMGMTLVTSDKKDDSDDDDDGDDVNNGNDVDNEVDGDDVHKQPKGTEAFWEWFCTRSNCTLGILTLC